MFVSKIFVHNSSFYGSPGLLFFVWPNGRRSSPPLHTKCEREWNMNEHILLGQHQHANLHMCLLCLLVIIISGIFAENCLHTKISLFSYKIYNFQTDCVLIRELCPVTRQTNCVVLVLGRNTIYWKLAHISILETNLVKSDY